MEISEIIKNALKERGTTQTKLAATMGYSSTGTLGNKLHNNNITTKVFVDILDILGYEVVVQPKTQGKRKDGAMVLTNKESENG